MTELEEDDVALLVDIDCFPLERQIVDARSPPRARAVSSAARNQAIISTPTIFVAPMFMAISRRAWDRLGRPSFRPDPATTSRSVSTRSRRRRASRSTCFTPGGRSCPNGVWAMSGFMAWGHSTKAGSSTSSSPERRLSPHFLRRCRGRAERSSGRLFRADGERSDAAGKRTLGAPLHTLAQGDMAASAGQALPVDVIPIYVINLARSPERRAWMEAELARADVERFFCTLSTGDASARIARATLTGPFQGRAR